MAFCQNCGAPVAGAFCGACGTAAGSVPASAPQPQQAAAAPQPAPAVATPSAKPGGSSALAKILITLLVLFLLFVVAIFGGVVYVGYRAKKKADEIKQAYKSNDLDKLASAVGVSEKDRREAGLQPSKNKTTPALSFPSWSGSAAGDSRVALQPGLTVITAIAQPNGDYESMKRIEKISDTGVQLAYRADNVPDPSSNARQQPGQPAAQRSIASHRTVLAQDFKSSHEYAQNFSPQQPDVVPGTTAISVSQVVLEELKSKGETSFTYQAVGLKGMLGGLFGNLAAYAGGNVDRKDTEQLTNLGKNHCVLKRTNDGLHAIPVLLNDSPTTLPAIHAQCKNDDDVADFYLLDNPQNPLMLAWKLGSGDALQVVKISYAHPAESRAATRQSDMRPGGGAGQGSGGGSGTAGAQAIEQKLKETRKVDVYGIYFDFASDKLKPESDAVLQEIGQALKDNPDWKLQLNGHTDNIGGDDYNLDLSKRRAAAVKQALVARYHVSSARLGTSGFGASQPKDTNDTLYGRARNRRVELIRED